jgi:hypothetical protein
MAGLINIPSKIGRVSAVRVLAGQRRDDDLRRGILIAALSPGLIDTGALGPWLQVRGAPEGVAGPLIELAFHPSPIVLWRTRPCRTGRAGPVRVRHAKRVHRAVDMSGQHKSSKRLSGERKFSSDEPRLGMLVKRGRAGEIRA